MSRRSGDSPDARRAPGQPANRVRAAAEDGADHAAVGRPRDVRREARDAAVAYLARAAHSRQEVIRYLSVRRQAPADIAREVADALEREGLLNDRRLAERIAEVATGGRTAQSRAMLVRRLRRRGIAGDIVREAVSAQPIDELAAARRLASAKWREQNERLARRPSTAGDGVAREAKARALRAVGAHLGRKGFSGEVILQILAELGANEE